MKGTKRIIIAVLLSLLSVLLIAVIVFACSYASRIRTMTTIEKVTNYSDGYNLYRMNVEYDYDLDEIINYGCENDQDFADAIVKEALPGLPVSIEVPNFGCSAFTLKADDGDVMMGRNYDFRYNTSAMLVFCTPKDGYKSVAFAALDNVKANDADGSIRSRLTCLTAPFVCLDGMNEKGVSIAVLTLDSKPTRQDTGKPNISTSMAIRLVLDRAATTEEAVQLLKQYDMMATAGRDYHFYITDASGDGRVVEWDCESDSRELVDTPTRTVTNFFIIHKDKVTNKKDKNGIYGHGLDRYEDIEGVFNAASKKDGSVAWQALMKASQDPGGDVTSNTQWSIVFNNTDLSLEFVLHKDWENVLNYDLNTNTVDASE